MLGSALHNLKVPFRGEFMTALSIVLLVAARRLRPRQGLLWRAGLVCAALKSISPSAVLLGPMVAISMEASLMEAATMLLGANAAGFALGGGLAMTWTLAQSAAETVVLYGTDILSVFLAAVGRAQSGLGFSPSSAGAVLSAAFGAYFLMGAAAALAGLGVPTSPPAPPDPAPESGYRPALAPAAPPRVPASALALVLNVAAIFGVLSAFRALPLAQSVLAALAAVALWSYLYPAAGRRLAKPKFWITLAVVCAASGALMSRAGYWKGAEIGLRMCLRAMTLIAGFAAVSQELARSPWRRLAPRVLDPLLAAVDAAFSTLPFVMDRLPAPSAWLKAPRASVGRMLARTLETPASDALVYLIVGEKVAGKTAFVERLARAVRERGDSAGGIAAPGLWEKDERQGFDVIDLSNGDREPLCRRDGPSEWTEAAGPYRFSPAGLYFGLAAIARARQSEVDVLFIDEVGPLELQGGGWAPELERIARERRKPTVLVVRESLVEAVRERFGLRPAAAWRPTDDPADAAAALFASLPAR
ncbi:MAG: DUF2478 domain-containing protein [Elusimicrobia bacterium]|nr:DUF2478 domain-containing protein [Elusimicrobiota bacterium]